MRGRKIPFSIDRSDWRSLVEQLKDGLREAIFSGYYRPGDTLPSYRELAPLLDVSEIVTKAAIKQLAAEGLVSARPRIGTVVRDLGEKLWKGQVLIVSPSGGTYHYMNTVCAALCDALIANGYLALTVTVPRTAEGKFDFAMLDLMMRQQVDLVVQLHDKPEIAKWLSARKIPFARLTADVSKRLPTGCVGAVRRSNEAADAAFAAHCREAGIKNIVVATAWNSRSVMSSLRKAGIGVERWHFGIPHGMAGARVAQCAFDAVSERLAKSKGSLQELVFFDDDFLASGALVAMLHAGVRIPEDVRFATLFNCSGGGSGIAFAVPITRMEVDSDSDGCTMADAVLSYLRTGDFPLGLVVGPKYIRGGTF